MILFLSAIKQEREAVRRAWRLERGGTIEGGLELHHGEGCVHLCTGMGADRVVQGLETGVRVFRPRLVALVGYSVGLQSDMSVGRVLADSRSHQDFHQSFVGVRIGPVATCGFLLTASQKAAFAERHPEAPAADLESEAFLEAVPPEVRAVVVRSVSDDRDTDLPLDFSKLSDERGFPSPRAIALALSKRPHALGSILRLAKDSRVATRTLGDFLSQTKDEWMELARN